MFIHHRAVFAVFTPAKFVDHDSDSQRPDHASRAENGHSKTPHHGDGSFAERLPVPVRGHIMEKTAQFLSHKEIKAAELGEFALLDFRIFFKGIRVWGNFAPISSFLVHPHEGTVAFNITLSCSWMTLDEPRTSCLASSPPVMAHSHALTMKKKMYQWEKKVWRQTVQFCIHFNQFKNNTHGFYGCPCYSHM